MKIMELLGADDGETQERKKKRTRVRLSDAVTTLADENGMKLGEGKVAHESIMGEPIPINLDNLNSETTQHVTVRPKPEGGRLYSISIQDGIGAIEDYWDILNALAIAQPEDEIVMTVVSPGGNLETATLICSAMERCQAPITAIASGICASAGSFIWSCADKCVSTWNAYIMYHMSSNLAWGKTTIKVDESNALVEFVKKILHDYSVSKGLLTEEEYKKIVEENGTVWILGADMQKRIGGISE